MHETILRPGWETVLVAIPFLFLLFVGMFRLDEVLVRRKKEEVNRPRPLCGVDDDGAQILTDPDGKIWHEPSLHK
jgi:hypothetical protein